MIAQELFKRGDGGYHTCRIPSLAVTARGTVLAICEGRKNSSGDSGDIDIVLKRSTDGGRTWSGQQVVWDDGANTCGNPCMVLDRQTHVIWLLLTWNHGGGVHSCGKFMHQIPGLLALPSLRCIDFGQSHMNDVDAVYQQARGKKVGLLRVRANREELSGGTINRRFPTGVSLLFEARSLDEAKTVIAEYRNFTVNDNN